MSTSKLQSQRGSTLLGFILGLVIGLTVALGVAMYVTKVPMPFSNKNQSRSAEQDAVESQKNKDW
ncbi:MAG: sporulation protein, partial [Betaproteobacteria bacterium]|nr:sporulation protein [Betaproteobacteria bacterium]